MRVRADACWLPKAGNSDAEYEDAVWPTRATEVEGPRFQCAVADGASETSFAGLWAALLVRAYCRNQIAGRRANDTLRRLRREWSTGVLARPLAWYAQEKAAMGAYSTLTGLTLIQLPGRRIRWHALAVGDSCLFHLRDGALLAAFPHTRSQDFSSRPQLLGSTGQSPTESVPMLWTGGEARTGDHFFLMTDALGCWFLREWEAGAVLHDLLRSESALDPVSFTPWIERLRCSKAIRNDDVTVLRLEVT